VVLLRERGSTCNRSRLCYDRPAAHRQPLGGRKRWRCGRRLPCLERCAWIDGFAHPLLRRATISSSAFGMMGGDIYESYGGDISKPMRLKWTRFFGPKWGSAKVEPAWSTSSS
jgi:hypothetical protein